MSNTKILRFERRRVKPISADLLAANIRNYAKLPDELQAELPLKRIWALVLEE